MIFLIKKEVPLMCKELLEAATETNIEKYCVLVERFPSLKSDEVLEYLRDANYFTAPSSWAECLSAVLSARRIWSAR